MCVWRVASAHLRISFLFPTHNVFGFPAQLRCAFRGLTHIDGVSLAGSWVRVCHALLFIAMVIDF